MEIDIIKYNNHYSYSLFWDKSILKLTKVQLTFLWKIILQFILNICFTLNFKNKYGDGKDINANNNKK